MPVAVGSQGLVDDSAGEAIGKQRFHYTLDNRSQQKTAVIVYTAEHTVRLHRLIKPPTISKPIFLS